MAASATMNIVAEIPEVARARFVPEELGDNMTEISSSAAANGLLVDDMIPEGYRQPSPFDEDDYSTATEEGLRGSSASSCTSTGSVGKETFPESKFCDLKPSAHLFTPQPIKGLLTNSGSMPPNFHPYESFYNVPVGTGNIEDTKGVLALVTLPTPNQHDDNDDNATLSFHGVHPAVDEERPLNDVPSAPAESQKQPASTSFRVSSSSVQEQGYPQHPEGDCSITASGYAPAGSVTKEIFPGQEFGDSKPPPKVIAPQSIKGILKNSVSIPPNFQQYYNNEGLPMGTGNIQEKGALDLATLPPMNHDEDSDNNATLHFNGVHTAMDEEMPLNDVPPPAAESQKQPASYSVSADSRPSRLLRLVQQLVATDSDFDKSDWETSTELEPQPQQQQQQQETDDEDPAFEPTKTEIRQLRREISMRSKDLWVGSITADLNVVETSGTPEVLMKTASNADIIQNKVNDQQAQEQTNKPMTRADCRKALITLAILLVLFAIWITVGLVMTNKGDEITEETLSPTWDDATEEEFIMNTTTTMSPTALISAAAEVLEP